MADVLDSLQQRRSWVMNGQPQHITLDATPLTRLIARLEAATSRLEDIASSAAEYEPEAGANGAPTAPGAKSAKGVPLAAAGVAAAGASPTPKPQEDIPPMIGDLDTLIRGDVADYVKLSNAPAFGGPIGEQVRPFPLEYLGLQLIHR
jgi:hypothetical protein